LAAAAVVAGMCGEARAQVLQWDGDGISPASGGSGLWDSVGLRWSDGASPTDVPWDNSGTTTASFGPIGGVIQQSETIINANDLKFSANYLIVNPATGVQKLNLTSGVVDTGANFVEVLPQFFGTQGLTKNGTGTLVFHGINGYAGPTTVNTGTLALGNTQFADIPSASVVTVAAGATLSMNLYGGAYNDNFASLQGSGTVNLGTNFYGESLQSTGSTMTLLSGGTDFAGTITGAGGRLTLGAGNSNTTNVSRLSGVNTFAGRVDISSFAKLQVAGGSALADTIPVTLTTASTLELQSDETIGYISSAAGAGTSISTVQLNGNALTLNTGSYIFPEFRGTIAGTGKVVKTGSGVQLMSIGTNPSTYSGGTEVRGGILVVSNDTKLGASAGGLTLDGGTLSNFAGAGNVGTISNSRAISVGTNGGGLQVITDSSTDRTNTFAGVVSGPGLLTKSGPGTVVLSNVANTFAGGLTIAEGIVNGTAPSGTPFGTGSLTLQRGRLAVQPGSGAAANTVITAASAAGGTVSYGAGSELLVNHASASTLSFQVGPSGAASNSVLNRQAGGTLLILPSGGVANLGNTNVANAEQIIVNGGVPTVNGIVSPSIVSTTTGLVSSVGEFLGYDPNNGLVLANYTSTDLSTATGTNVVKHTSGDVVLANPTTVYALNTNRNVSGAALTIGNGTGAAGLILNGVGSGSSISTSALTFDGSDATIYSQNTNPGAISAPVTITGSGGLTKFGLGAITISAPWTYTGQTRIAGGAINVAASDVLPATTDLVLTGTRGTTFSGSISATLTDTSLGNQSTFRLVNGSTQTVKSLASENTFALVDLGTGTLTLNQNTSTVFRGTFAGSNGGGTLVLNGTGKLSVNPYNGASFATGTSNAHFTSTYGKLVVKGGATFEFNQFNALPVVPDTAQTDSVTLDGGTLRFTGSSSQFTDFTATGNLQSFATNRGYFLGPGGGTLDIVMPTVLAIIQRGNGEDAASQANIFNGPGDLIKTGEGSLRLGFGNLNTGRFIFKGGRIQAQQGQSLGATPADLKTDAIVFDGGVFENNGTGLIESTRGIFVAAGGGSMSGNFTISSPLAGAGKLTKINTSPNGAQTTMTFNGTATGTFTGLLSVEAGILSLPAGGAPLGSGTIGLNPKFPIFLNKTGGTTDSVVNNPVTLGAGSTIDIRVDANVGDLVLNGKVTGPGNLYRTAGNSSASSTIGAGTLTLANGANDFTGQAIVLQGTLNATANGALGAASAGTFVAGGAGGAAGGSVAFSGGVNYTTPEPITISGQGIGLAGALRTLGGDNTFAGPVTIGGNSSIGATGGASLKLTGVVAGPGDVTKVGDGKVILANAANVISGDVTVNTGELQFAANHRLKRLKVEDNAVASLGTGRRVLRVADLALNDFVNPQGTVDVSDGILVIDYDIGLSPHLLIKAAVTAGYNTAGPAHWTGKGITSSAAAAGSGKFAVGYAEAAQVVSFSGPSAIFEGQVVDDTTYLVRYTLTGDATLDGTVDFNDLVRLAQNYNGSAGDPGWFNGDFNFDGIVDFNDLVPLAQNYNTSLPAPAQLAQFGQGFGEDLARAFAAVPEPGTLAGLGVAAAATMFRRRRRGA
jgi:autotransporter-associated beta strand protein